MSFDGSEATQSAALPFNVSHLLIALAISGASEIGTSKTATAGSAEHEAVAAANKLRAADPVRTQLAAADQPANRLVTDAKTLGDLPDAEQRGAAAFG